MEIALAKRMKLNGLTRDHIISFFVRPGRVISPAFVSEISKIRPDISPATTPEVEAFVARRLREVGPEDERHGFGPIAALRVREILQFSTETQRALPGLESHFAELKSELPSSKEGKAKIAKTLVSFSNHLGGYIFFGLNDSGEIIGISSDANIEKFWDDLSDIVSGHFTPFFRWDRNLVDFGGKSIAVAYAYPASDKPVIATHDYTKEICDGSIYFRYERNSKTIRAGELLTILKERDNKAVAQAKV